MKKLFIIIFIISVPLIARAQVGDKITYLSTRYLSHSLWLNPAIAYDMHSINTTTISLNALTNKNEQASIAETGFGGKQFFFDALTYTQLDNNDKVYGEAYYKTETVYNQLWNENIDYSMIYPYVVGDSIGGDMNIETYYFKGGYVKRFKRNTLGVEMAYRAAIGFRDTDPRPHNTVSDLDLKIGVSRLLGSYTLGLSASTKVYKQNSTITYYADIGATDVYQMLGLGYDYTRFSGDKTSSRYEGSQWGATLDLKQEGNNGLQLSLGAKMLDVTKILTALNYVPINLVNEKELSFDGAYNQECKAFSYKIHLSAYYKHRTGTENVLGAATDNVYPVISSSSPFMSQDINSQLDLLAYGHNSTKTWCWMVSPYVNINMLEQSYTATNTRYYEISNARAGFNAQSLWNRQKLVYILNASFGMQTNLKSDYSLAGLDTNTSVAKSQLSNINYLATEYTQFSAGAEVNYLLNTKYALTVGVVFTQTNYTGLKNNNLLTICAGLKF